VAARQDPQDRQIAGLQREHGAAGITVATLAEAEYFAGEGFDDILLAYPPVGDWRLARLTDLARRARLRVVLDDAGVLAGLIKACRAAGVAIGYLWEVDCGTGRVFYDATQVALGLIGPPGCALSVLATVIGRPDPRRVILDAGSKALSAERLTPRAPGFGLVLGHPELTVERLYEQHAIAGAPHGSGLRVGDRVRIVPNHACTTANLHRRALVAEGDEVVDVWSIGAAGPGG
jgi:D-serine deaminase-like pyridoxal phosphate-dependent protein